LLRQLFVVVTRHAPGEPAIAPGAAAPIEVTAVVPAV
jgi:hypothetical protein